MKTFLNGPVFRFLWSLGLAAILYTICPPCFSKTQAALVLGILAVLINLAPWTGKKTILIQSARVLVGGLFIFSGFIKANDTLGFSYKLEEYFEVFQHDTGWTLFAYIGKGSLVMAIALCAVEMILGLTLILGFKIKLTLWLLLAQIVFFTFLTFYSACYNKVTHCGCFGDFLKLKPWESFWKDIVLLVLITLLFSGEKLLQPLMQPMLLYSVTALLCLLSIGFPLYTYRHLPVFDFRAYAPGMNIIENMKKGPGYQDPVYESRLVYKNTKTGQLRAFTQNEFMASKIWEDTLTWTWHATENKLVKEAVNPPLITDLTLSALDGQDLTDSLLKSPGYKLWIIAYDITKTQNTATLWQTISDFKKLSNQAQVPLYLITSSAQQDIKSFLKQHQLNTLPVVICDAIVLKTMIRSNPGLMLLKQAKVIKNWHYNDWPVFETMKQLYFNSN